MKKALIAVSVFMLFCLMGFESAAGEWEKLSPEQKKILESGKPLFEHVELDRGESASGGYARSLILINKPLQESWKIFCQVDKHHEYFPRQKSTLMVESTANHALLQKVFEFYVAEISYYVIYDIDHEKHRIDYHIDKTRPHDTEETKGFFMFEKIQPDTTLFIYAVTEVELGVSVPKFIMNYVTSKDLPNVAEHVKKRIESGGTWEK